MIGIRALLLGLAAAVLAGAAVAGAGGPDPSWQLAADRRVVEAARGTDAQLAVLERTLELTLEPARRGATRVVGGEEAPGPLFLEAASHAETAEQHARGVTERLVDLDSARRARDPGTGVVEPPLSSGEMSSIAAQMEATADVGDDFARMRRRADEVTASLDRSLAALEAGQVASARRAVEESRAAFDDISAWEVGLPSLPVWLETVDAMIGAVEALVTATEDGDAERGAEAAERFAEASSDAAMADRALRIAISEGGSAVAAPALGRVAAALAAVQATRAEVAAILQAAGR